MKPNILIYQDYVHNNGVLYRTLCREYGYENVGFCDAQDILDGCLTPAIHLLVMPGGADLYYCEKLNGDGNKRIKNYVEAGGNYLGICAGAYYSCREIEWAKGTDHEISGPRELALINCKAVGAISKYTRHESDIDYMSAAARLTDGDEDFFAHYWGGPQFTDLPDTTKTIASYRDLDKDTAAVIKDTYGAGTVILSSVHFERNREDLERSLYYHLNDHPDLDQQVIHDIRSTETILKHFQKQIFNNFH